jgi:muramoyltetrapeptide carboxypeptidase
MGAKVKMDVNSKGATLTFDIDAKKKEVDTGKLTPKVTSSKALLKMLSGKTFAIEE